MSRSADIAKPKFVAQQIALRDGREVVIRAGTPDDAAALLAYMQRCLPDFAPFVAMDPDEFTMTEADERAWLESQQTNPGAFTLLALAGSQVVAVLNCSCRSERRRVAHLGHLGMSSDKSYWGSGLGGEMLAAMIDWAERHPVLELLELDVFADNERALALYRGSGFVQSGVVPGRARFADGSSKDGVMMFRRVDGTLCDQPKPGDFSEDLDDGVVLRKVRYGDAAALYVLYERNRERFRQWFRWAPGIRSVGDVRGAIAQWTDRAATHNKLTCVLEQGDTLLGMVYIVRHDAEDRRVELGYWLDEGQEGRGLVTHGCRALMRYAFEQLGVNRIDITADVNNQRSQSVAARLGFTRESVIHQWLRFADGRFADMANYRLLRQDWDPSEADER